MALELPLAPQLFLFNTLSVLLFPSYHSSAFFFFFFFRLCLSIISICRACCHYTLVLIAKPKTHFLQILLTIRNTLFLNVLVRKILEAVVWARWPPETFSSFKGPCWILLEQFILSINCLPTKKLNCFCQLLQFPHYRSRKVKIKFIIIYANMLYPMAPVCK